MTHRLDDPRLSVWPALLLAPLLALGHLSLAFAMVTPTCARQGGAGLHGLSALSLLAALAMTLLAWRAWRRLGRPEPLAHAVTASDSGERADRPRFVALVAVLTGALSALVILALWLPLWVLPACS
jgi:hypothetical protein